jgi:hypothetical protein
MESFLPPSADAFCAAVRLEILILQVLLELDQTDGDAWAYTHSTLFNPVLSSL